MAVLPAWLSWWCSGDHTRLVMGGRGFKSRSGQTFFQTYVYVYISKIYIYIYTRLQKHCYFRNIYHIYVWMPKKDLSKVDTHYTSPVVWSLLAIFFYMHICLFWCWQKRYRRRKGITIYMIYMFWNSNVFENVVYLTIIPWARVGYEMVNSQRDA